MQILQMSGAAIAPPATAFINLAAKVFALGARQWRGIPVLWQVRNAASGFGEFPHTQSRDTDVIAHG